MIEALRTPDDRRWYRLSLGALVLAAWGALALWGASPFAGLLDHRQVGPAGATGAGPGALPPAVRLAAFVVGWTLMTVAMMLPGSLPLVTLFRRFVAPRADGPRLLALLGAGYLAVWALFGLVAYLADGLLHAAVAAVPGRAGVAGGIGTALLLAAGAYQLTPLKTRCLERCRSPYTFLVQHWRGRRPGRQALRLGVRHGLFCLGCGWTLMLLMFAVGGINLGWMLGLGAVMAAERASRWGRRLTRPLGAALILWAVLHLTGHFAFPAA
jgi:predicted metal-binding membrane protein